MGRKRFADRRLCQKAAPRFHTHLALCVMYTGSGFRGLQLQTHCPTHHTVEGVLIQALTDIGLIKAIERGKPHDNVHHLARACRTDRGVHAIRNVVTLFVPTNKLEWLGNEVGLQAELNSRLPHSIKVGCVVRVTGNFVPRHCCNRRVYRYLIPLYALLPKCDSWETFCNEFTHAASDINKLLQTCRTASKSSTEESCHQHQQEEKQQQEEQWKEWNEFVESKDEKLPYVDITENLGNSCSSTQWLQEVHTAVNFCNDVLQEYIVGSHRFHNFSNSESNKSEFMSSSLSSSSSSFSSADKLYDPNSDEAARMIYRCEIAPRVYFLNAHKHGASYEEYVHNTAIVQRARREKQCEDSSETKKDDKVCNECAQQRQHLAESTSPSTISDSSLASVNESSRSKESGQLSHLPFVILQIEGGSFLFNMIRKIVGTLLAVCRGARRELFSDALCPSKRVSTPLAPGAYLLLAFSSYRGYDNYVYACRESRLRQHWEKNKQQEEAEEEKELWEETEESECGKEITKAPATSSTKAETCKELKLSNRTELKTFEEVWNSEETESFEEFARECIYSDIVDMDLNRLPSLEAMLLARDEAHDILRPQWRTVEDVHLQTMKEYSAITPDVIERVGHARCSAMTLFLRLLRVHNWSIREVQIPQNSKAMLEMQNKKRRKMEICEELQVNESINSCNTKEDCCGCNDANKVTMDGKSNTTHAMEINAENVVELVNIEDKDDVHKDVTVTSTAEIKGTTEGTNSNDEDEDGWIYVAANKHEECLLRQIYHGKNSSNKLRTWERSIELINANAQKL